MKQVFYSDVLNKYFDSEEECKKAESEHALAKRAEEEKKNEISKQKKVLADDIEKAEKELDAAYSKLEIAREESDRIYSDAKASVNQIYKEANEKVKILMDEAKAEVRKAQQNKVEAVKKFNEKFGVYTTTYTGNKALEEIRRVNSWINDLSSWFFF